MLLSNRTRKSIALFLAINLATEVFAPNLAWALTGGPSQPEVDSFEPVNTTQMVDLFSGDFNYNIPLLDVGGYPVNLAYHSGIGMEQEASWVGLGWNINVGNITRNMRGVPDDFNGDEINKEYKLKPNITKGLNAGLDLQIFGASTKNEKKLETSTDNYNNSEGAFQLKNRSYAASPGSDAEKFLVEMQELSKIVEGESELLQKLRWNIDFGIFRNSYKGDGISIDISRTMGKSNNMVHAKLGMGFNSQNGSDLSLSFIANKKNDDNSFQSSVGLGYNSLDGLKSVSFSSEQNTVKDNKILDKGVYSNGSCVAIGLSSYTPSYQFSMINLSFNLHLTAGSEATGLHGNQTFSGFYSMQKLRQNSKSYHAYGYLHDQDNIKNVTEDGFDDMMLDFNRMNDRSFDKFLTNMPMATGMYDVYSVQGQGTGGSFRPHRNSMGIYFDPTVESNPKAPFNTNTNSVDIGGEFGVGANVHIGIPISAGGSTSKSGVWWKDNELFTNFHEASTGELFENVYFRSAGDGGPFDATSFDNFGGENPARFELEKTGVFRTARKFAKIRKDKLRVETRGSDNTWWDKIVPEYKSLERVARNSTISYLTNKEATSGIGMDINLLSYKPGFWEGGATSKWPIVYARYGADFKQAKEHHIGEIIQTNADGTRYVYGLPAINKYQKDVVFNVSKALRDNDASTHSNNVEIEKELVEFLPGTDNGTGNTRGPDYFFQSTAMPAYAHSYNLTGVLSPDYVDVTGNGITDDDLGTAVKFNYTRVTDNYQWRTPYEQNRGRYNSGHLSDPSDDKASYVYGEKELWYLHSVESKTHVAVFKFSARDDGRGVLGEAGGRSNAVNNQMMKLDSIVLYSKLDLLNNPGNATPVKTVVFKYTYELCKDVPNHKDFVDGSGSNKGKLTLVAVYFTYGKNNRGQLSPYKFTYSNYNPKYSLAQFDCWGNYKKSTQGVPNREFPYLDVMADSLQIDSAAEAWSLKKIELPSGAKINVKYESDDYAYVQDKKAMNMLMIEGMANDSNSFYQNSSNNKIYDEGLKNNFIFFKNPDVSKITTSEQAINELFRDELGNYLVHLYYRVKVNMNPGGDKKNSNSSGGWEYVSGWASIKPCQNTKFKPHVGLSDSFIWVELELINQGDVGWTKAHPMAKAAWQVGLQELRPVLFPGSAPNQTGKSEFLGLLNAFSTALNIFTGPYENLRWKKIASLFQPKHSYIRLYNHNGFKKGGGVRVKELMMEDNWQNMNTDESGASYGQKFSYTTINNNKIISSGVASWEPQIGGDQNPFHQPVFPNVKIHLGPSRSLFQEKPFMEQLYPGASVGYSKVRVTSLGNNGSLRSSTGYTVNEFYTSKDYPVIEEYTDLQRLKNGSGIVKFLKSALVPIVKDAQAASQGYVLELNDMHGKPKSVKTYGEKSGSIDVIAGNEYYYHSKMKNSKQQLDNEVSVLNKQGEIEKAYLSMEYDVSVDTRKSYSNNWHGGTKIGFDNSMSFVVPHAIPKFKKQITMLQTAVVCKIIQKYGIMDSVKAFDFGSEVTTQNLLWDKETGGVLLTRTTNEFDDNIYNFSYPAHLAYDRMGPAYKNLDYSEAGKTINSKGMCSVVNSDNFVPGDELLLKTPTGVFRRGWVLKTGANKIKIIDRGGFPFPSGKYDLRIIRSGRRNLQSTPVGAVTTMYNPMDTVNGKVVLNQKVINTSAVEYSENWPGSINSGSFFTRICDTLDPVPQLALITAHYHWQYAIDSIDHFIFGAPGLSSGNPINLDSTFNWFDTSTLKKYLDSSFCKDINDSCEIQYYMGKISPGNTFALQIRYRCNPEMPWIVRTTCTYNSGGGTWTGIGEPASVQVFYSSEFVISRIAVYDVSHDSTDFDIPLSCLTRLIICHDVLNCQYTLGDILNPYVNGVRGIWRPKTTWAFVGQRKYNYVKDTTSIRHDGLIKDYVPFWTFSNTLDGIYPTGKSNKKWVNSTTATIFSPQGNGLEEVDALGIYKSQLYGYNNTLVTAVAANARYRQIAFDNFEDYNYTIGECEVPGHFDFRIGMSSSYQWITLGNGRTKIRNFTNPASNTYIRKDTAHSGLYSIALKPGISHFVSRYLNDSAVTMHSPTDTGLFNITSLSNTIPLFQPDDNQKYVLSAWVTEDLPNKNAVNTFSNAIINVKVYNNGTTILNQNFAATGKIIEGWQRVQGVFNISKGADSIRITLVNGSGSVKAGFDDIRINPFNSSMKCYVFNPVLLKAMAELDDNNFTTFYEYDAEGSLVRVKRETERGIMTVQENRKGIRKNQ